MKILLWDIETWPITATTWDLWPRNGLDHKNILNDWGIICAAWKWLGEKPVHAQWISPLHPNNDIDVIKALHKVLSEADVLVAHNGDEFDLKKFNARAIKHGLPPLPPIKTIDTLKVAKKYFNFTSNRLDYLGGFLGVGRKIPTHFGMWLDIMKGDAESLARMVKYNKQDVRLLEDVYLKLRPFMTDHPNENLFNVVDVCPVCGGKKFKKQGFKYTRQGAKQQYQCLADKCHAWFVGEVVKRVKLS